MNGAATDDAEPTILHVDLDAFYASVEQLENPDLRGQPVIVGGLGPRGVVAAASYEARPYGVQSAMPMAHARRACPDGVFIAPRFDAYQAASRNVMAILRAFTPIVEPIALDEAFLDVSGARRLHGAAPDIATAIRARVHAETGLTASVGVATTKMVAKIASDLAKPDGVLVVEAGRELDFLHPLGVERLWGVGPATRRRLDRLGVQTIGELAALSEENLVASLGGAHGRHLHALAWNRDPRPVEPVRHAKSMGHEETFARDVADREVLRREIVRLADRVGQRLRAAAHAGRTIQLKLRYGDFRTITRSRTLADPTDLGGDIARVANSLLEGVDITEGVRLIGVSVQQLEPVAVVQGTLPLPLAARDDTDADERRASKRGAVEASVDRIRRRFGDDAVVPARIAGTEDHRTPWGPDADAEGDDTVRTTRRP